VHAAAPVDSLRAMIYAYPTFHPTDSQIDFEKARA
jgi:hypothetical protein